MRTFSTDTSDGLVRAVTRDVSGRGKPRRVSLLGALKGRGRDLLLDARNVRALDDAPHASAVGRNAVVLSSSASKPSSCRPERIQKCASAASQRSEAQN